MEYLYEVIGQLTGEQTSTLGLISVAGVALLGVIGSILTVILNKRSERKMELRKIKEAQYIDFLSSLAEAKAGSKEEKYSINMKLSSRIQTIYLVGNIEVQTALSEFLKILSPDKVAQRDQNILYANLIRAMKKDLYGYRCKSMDSVNFTIFSK